MSTDPPGSDRIHLFAPGPVDLDRRLVPGSQFVPRDRFPSVGQIDRSVQVLGDGRSESECMHEAHCDSTAKNRIGACPGIRHREPSGRHWLAISVKSPLTVGDACHRQHLTDRFGVDEVGTLRVGSHDPVEGLRIPDPPQCLVGIGPIDGHRPGVIVGGESANRDRSAEVLREDVRLWESGARFPVVPGVVGEAEVTVRLGRLSRPDVFQECRQGRAASRSVDHDVCSNRLTTRCDHSGDVGDPGDGFRSDCQADHLHAASDIHRCLLPCRNGEGEFVDGSTRGEGGESIILCFLYPPRHRLWR